MSDWLKNYPIAAHTINIVLCLIIMILFIRIYINARIDNRIINDYQKPVIEKLDTLINMYDNGSRY